jgi:hypothetical protein
MKEQNAWSDDLDIKFGFKKRKFDPMLMDNFQLDFAVRISRAKINKILSEEKKKKRKPQFGDDKREKYMFYEQLMITVEEICRQNRWMTRKQMDEHNVPIIKLFKDFVGAATEYADVLRYYQKAKFDERRRLHLAGVRMGKD